MLGFGFPRFPDIGHRIKRKTAAATTWICLACARVAPFHSGYWVLPQQTRVWLFNYASMSLPNPPCSPSPSLTPPGPQFPPLSPLK